MTLFVTFGSWGEIAPLLEICIRVGGEFLTTDDWAPRVREYGVKCHEIPSVKHSDTLDAFIRAHLLGRQSLIYDTIAAVNPSNLVASFYAFPAQAYAEKNQIPIVATTTSPYYFMQTERADSLSECVAEYESLRSKLGLKNDNHAPVHLAGVYPWYLHTDVGAIPVGFPQLRSLNPLSEKVADFIKSPYGVVSRGTLVSKGESQRMINAIRAYGLGALYLGPHDVDADCVAFLDDHAAAVSRATIAFTHAGIGTTIDCMGSPMVVCPAGYDQFYNANRLIDLKCAVGVKDSYIRAIDEAIGPRSYLPNYFDHDLFMRLMNADSTSQFSRSTANAGECPQIH